MTHGIKVGLTFIHEDERLYDFNLIGLRTDRETLYDKINKRVDRMFDEGLLNEAKNLYNKHYKKFTSIIGYKELSLYFENKITLEEARELIKQNSRRYAKRQFTWFYNQMKDITWIDVNYNNINETISIIKEFLKI